MLDRVFAETYRVLVSGGRACVNTANVGRRPYVPLHSHIITLMLKTGFSCAARSSGTRAGGRGVHGAGQLDVSKQPDPA